MRDIKQQVTPQDNSFKTIVVMSVLLSSSYFFYIFILPKNLILLAQTLILGVIVLFNLFNVVYLKRSFYSKKFSLGIVIILVGSFLSIFSAYVYHHQSPVLTVWAQKGMFFYLFYYLLHMLNVSDKKLIELISLTGLIYAICYLLQFVAFPRVIFDVKQSLDRGTIRIALPGAAFMIAAYFISLQKALYNKSIKDMLLLVLFLIIVVLKATRNMIAMVAFISFVGIIISKKVKYKSVMYLLFLACGVSIFFVFKDMFMGLIELSSEQTKNAEDDVRARATEFFLTSFMPDKACYVLGNGMSHGRAAYGRQILSYKVNNGYFLSDIGFIGEYVIYGAVFALGVLVSFIKWFSIKPALKYMFTKYLFFWYLLALFFGGGWANDASIVLLCCVFYILDISNSDFLRQRIKKIIDLYS